MKKSILVALSLFISTQAFAHMTVKDLKMKSFKIDSASNEYVSNYLKVVPGEISGFSKYPNEMKKIQESFAVIEAVINSSEFKERVISFKGKGPLGGYTSNNKLTNEQIYDFLMQGRELIDGDKTPGEMNMDIKRWISKNPWSAVIARTFPGQSKWIEVNGKKYTWMSVTDIASNLTHEWIHLNGFLHDSASDADSVPYKVGDIMGELAEKYLAQGYLN